MQQNNMYSAASPVDHAAYCRRRRNKADWAGISVGDAFKQNLGYHLRYSAQQRFYAMVKRGQAEIVRMINGNVVDNSFEPKVKPQLSPCYTSYPSSLAVFAAAGLTAFLEYDARVQTDLFTRSSKEFLENPHKYYRTMVDKKGFKRVAAMTVHWVGKRITLEDLSRNNLLSTVELYRLFAASQETLSFHTVDEILKAVVLYGELLPPWEKMDLHPTTRKLLKALTKTSEPVFRDLQACKTQDLVKLGELWVHILCWEFIPYFPPVEKTTNPEPIKSAKIGSGRRSRKRWHRQPRAANQEAPEKLTVDHDLAPLEGKHSPELYPLRNVGQQALRAIQVSESNGPELNKQADAVDDATRTVLKKFNQSIETAGGQENEWEDMRSDILERALSREAFSPGPIEGSPVDGHEIHLTLDDDTSLSQEIFDKPAEYSGNTVAGAALALKAQPITEALRSTLYPSVEETPLLQRLRTSGSLDPARLACGDYSSVIFKRYPVKELADQRGRAVLAIACDGSGSLNSNQMQMVKLLSAGYLQATRKNDIQMMVALYHSGRVRKGLSGPLVQWLYHPKKNGLGDSDDAMAAVAALPESGTGIQSDALSLAFILEEARRLAKGKTTYLVVISDTSWNRSFKTSISGFEEVRSFFESAYKEMGKSINISLVALGVNEETGFEDKLDGVIWLTADELHTPAAAAEKIGVYVASTIRQRKTMILTKN